MEQIKLIVAKDYSSAPGPRYKHEGDWSGQIFRKELLSPLVRKAIQENKLLFVDLDGTAGYGTSFLEEAFGGLIREEKISYDVIKKVILLKSDEEPYLLEDIENYLKDAAAQSK